jgi:hypothetical protein
VDAAGSATILRSDSGATGFTGPVAPGTAAGAGEGVAGTRAAVVEMRALAVETGAAVAVLVVLRDSAGDAWGRGGAIASTNVPPAWGPAEGTGPGVSTTALLATVSVVTGAGVSGVTAAAWAGHCPAPVDEAGWSTIVVSRSVVALAFCNIASDAAGWSTARVSCGSSTGIELGT